jgi:predicted AAA+ superfamily ATPase
VNLLPGRIIPLRLDPLLLTEVPRITLEHCLLYGTLPGIFLTSSAEVKEEDLGAYSLIYLEEEVRAETLVRNLGAFARFLEVAATESGNVVNMRNISREVGVAHTTVSSYFEVLEDCLIVERIDPLIKSRTRKRLTKASKYLFFDLGVRRLCAREGVRLPWEVMGHLLEQWVGLELIRLCRIKDKQWKVRFWRDPNGPEVDWVIDVGNNYVPVEVKWTDSPTEKDIRHLNVFLREYSKTRKAYVICRTPKAVKLSDQVTALPWDRVEEVLAQKK